MCALSNLSAMCDCGCACASARLTPSNLGWRANFWLIGGTIVCGGAWAHGEKLHGNWTTGQLVDFSFDFS